MQITNDQGTDEWFNQRLGKATASRFADIMAKGRGSTEAAARKNYKAQLLPMVAQLWHGELTTKQPPD